MRNSLKKILIVDDDPDFVEGIQNTLIKAGYLVDTEYNPRDGFAALKDCEYDLLLLDILMGRGAEGVMLARKIRKYSMFKELPILVITGIREQIAFLFPDEAVQPGSLPVDDLIEKPVEPALLLEKVEALLQQAEKKKLLEI